MALIGYIFAAVTILILRFMAFSYKINIFIMNNSIFIA